MSSHPHRCPQLRHVRGNGASWDTTALLSPHKHHGSGFCRFMACPLLDMSSEPLGEKAQLCLDTEAAQQSWEGALAPLGALGSCLSIPPSIHTCLPYELCSLPLWGPMTSLLPMAYTASPHCPLLPLSLAAIMAKTSVLHSKLGQELLLDRPRVS